MKLYHFNPNDYGMEYFVMSDSEKNAIKSLNEFLQDQFEREVGIITDDNKPLQWGDKYFEKKVINGVVCSKGYTIDVYDVNQVIESEIS